MESLDLVTNLLDAGLKGEKIVPPPPPMADDGKNERVNPEKKVKKSSPSPVKEKRSPSKERRRRSRSTSRGRRRRSRSSSRSRRRSRSRSRDRHRRRRRRSRSRGRKRSRSRRRSRDRRSRSRSRGRRRRSPSPDDGAFEKKAETAEEKVLRDRIRDECTVLVSGLPVRATARDIATYFSQCGTIRDVRVIKDRRARVHKGFSYVELETPDEASAALRLTGALFQGRSLVVQPTLNEKNRAFQAKQAALEAAQGTHLPMKLYVGSLHFNVTEDALRSIFAPFGTLIEVVVHRDPDTQVSRGFAFVTFSKQAEAKRAMDELNGLEVLGRPMKVGESKEDSLSGGNEMAVGDRLEGDDAMTLNQHTRTLLMQKLQGGAEAEAAAPLSDVIQQSNVHVSVSRCLVIQNAFSAEDERARPDNEGWEQEIEDDVKGECGNYGRVDHIKLEPDSGCIYVRFDDVNQAIAARNALNGRFFGGQTISVEYVTSSVYERKYFK